MIFKISLRTKSFNYNLFLFIQATIVLACLLYGKSFFKVLCMFGFVVQISLSARSRDVSSLFVTISTKPCKLETAKILQIRYAG